MRRSKFLALVLAVAVMLMGAGYAAWTDQLTIVNTVKTGHLDLRFVAPEVPDSEVDAAEYTDGTVVYDVDAERGEGPDNTDKATITLNDMYPGAMTTVTLQIENNSTMPVLFNGVTPTGDYAMFDPTVAISFEDEDGNPVSLDLSNYSTWDDYEIPVGEIVTVEYTLTADENVAEEHTYTITVQPEFKQFNQ